MEEHDWYELLGCSIHSSSEEITKATRKLSLKYHPDKNPDPKAQDKFLLIQKAKNFLLDVDKRKEYDDNIRKILKRKEYDKERNKNMDTKRKKMRDDLEARMQNLNIPKPISKEEQAKMQKRQHDEAVERLRRENKSRMEESTNNARQKAKQTEEFFSHRRELSKHTDQCQNQIKVKWRRSKESHSDDTLYKLFGVYGTIEEVCFVGDKGGTAIITFTNDTSARVAMDAYATSEDYRVSLLSETGGRKAAIFTHDYDPYSQSGVASELRSHIQRAAEKEELLRRVLKSSRPGERLAETPREEGDRGTAVPRIDPSSLAKKESDVLARMLAAAAEKKKQQQDSVQSVPQAV